MVSFGMRGMLLIVKRHVFTRCNVDGFLILMVVTSQWNVIEMKTKTKKNKKKKQKKKKNISSIVFLNLSFKISNYLRSSVEGLVFGTKKEQLKKCIKHESF